jgi:hypothetical protein
VRLQAPVCRSEVCITTTEAFIIKQGMLKLQLKMKIGKSQDFKANF